MRAIRRSSFISRPRCSLTNPTLAAAPHGPAFVRHRSSKTSQLAANAAVRSASVRD
jgi:hypothetical protein